MARSKSPRPYAQPQIPAALHRAVRLEARQWGQPVPTVYKKLIEIGLPRLAAARAQLAGALADLPSGTRT
jgi:hypothetical protein